MRTLFFVLSLILFTAFPAQDTVYARQVIKKLASKKYFGRGYLNNGLRIAADYIESELKTSGSKPLFEGGYRQVFHFNVNTFPGKVSLKINNISFVPGLDYIISPESASLKGKFKMQKKDSVTWISDNGKTPLILNLKKKLTFGVATATVNHCEIDILKTIAPENIVTAEVNVQSKVLKKFENRNICAFVPGKENNDSMIVFSAHYDHLGGLGKKTYFPGANDNASGVSMLLNLVKHYTANPPKYKTVFVFFAGEEAGLIGSGYFVNNKTIDLEKIKFLVNLDLLGTGDDGIMVVNGAIHAKEFEMMKSINLKKGLVKEIRKRGKAQNSDHYWFSEAGVPAFFIYTLGGTTAYHDIYDTEKQLPLTDYADVFRLLTEFVSALGN